MNIKKGDNVIVIAGKDRGKTGKVVKVLPKKSRIVVEGLNKVKRHERPRRQGAKGQVVEVAMPMHVSNVMLVDPSSGKRTRFGVKAVGGKRVRVSKRGGGEL